MCAATVEFNTAKAPGKPLPPITIVVSSTDTEVFFKISDMGACRTHAHARRPRPASAPNVHARRTGGGFPRNAPIWSYMYTTGKEPEQTPDGSDPFTIRPGEGTIDLSARQTPLGGVGYGLPVARLYARYFGGDLRVFPMLGHGTDVHLRIKMLVQAGDTMPV